MHRWWVNLQELTPGLRCTDKTAQRSCNGCLQTTACRSEFGYLISKFGGEREVDPVTDQYGVALVFEPTECQNFLIGSSRQFLRYDTKVDHEVMKCAAKRAIPFFPEMGDMTLIRTYVGLRPWTADHLPIFHAFI